jgi:hypothetical protein
MKATMNVKPVFKKTGTKHEKKKIKHEAGVMIFSKKKINLTRKENYRYYY